MRRLVHPSLAASCPKHWEAARTKGAPSCLYSASKCLYAHSLLATNGWQQPLLFLRLPSLLLLHLPPPKRLQPLLDPPVCQCDCQTDGPAKASTRLTKRPAQHNTTTRKPLRPGECCPCPGERQEPSKSDKRQTHERKPHVHLLTGRGSWPMPETKVINKDHEMLQQPTPTLT